MYFIVVRLVPMELEGEDGFYDNMITLLNQKMEIPDSFKEISMI